MAKRVRWGMWGTGSIAHRFVKCAPYSPTTEFAAVASRTREKAEAFAAEHGLPRAYQGLCELVADPDIDVIYISSPHQAHCEDTLLALSAGKHVLCEKPFAVNRAQAQKMADTARSAGRFLMEAMWTRCFPGTLRVNELIAGGGIGAARMVTASFGFRTTAGIESRLINPATGGGGLLDVGVYALSYASMVYGGERPVTIEGVASIGPEGIDEQCSASLLYSGGRVAAVQCGVRTRMVTRAEIFGEDGMIIVPDFYSPKTVIIDQPGRGRREMSFPRESEGFEYEMDHVNDCVRRGLAESPLMTLDETLTIASTMDELRARWGLIYPFEKNHMTR